MDLNLAVLSGQLATNPEVRTFDSGARMVRLLVTTRADHPRRRIDVVPVMGWSDEVDDFDKVCGLTQGQRVWVAGSIQRRIHESFEGRRSRTQVVAKAITQVVE